LVDVPPSPPEIEPELLLAFAPLHRTALGVASGTVMGGVIFIATLFLVVKGGYPVGPNLALLGEFMYGYTVTLSGALIGFVWGFGIGFFIGWIFAVAHNVAIWLWLIIIRSQAEMDQYGDFLDHM
jgi:hypothetical protein